MSGLIMTEKKLMEPIFCSYNKMFYEITIPSNLVRFFINNGDFFVLSDELLYFVAILSM